MDVTGLAQKWAVVTGGQTALGRITATRLAEAGAHVLLVGTDEAQGAKVAAAFATRGPGTLTSITWDPRAQASVRATAADIAGRTDRLHVLVNHACESFKERQVTPDGVEATLAVNHLSSFLLTRLLTERLVAAAPSRVVNVSSFCHFRATINFDDLGFSEGWDNGKAIRRAKLCTVLFTRALARRLEGTGVTVNAVHPGGLPPDLWANAPRWVDPVVRAVDWCTLGAALGARRVLHLVQSPDVATMTGLYFSGGKPVKPSRHAQADPLVERLWEASEALVSRTS